MARSWIWSILGTLSLFSTMAFAIEFPSSAELTPVSVESVNDVQGCDVLESERGLQIVFPIFKPHLSLAQLRSKEWMAPEAPQNRSAIKTQDWIKYYGHGISNPRNLEFNSSARRLIWYLRFDEDVFIRRLAYFRLITSEYVGNWFEQIIAAAVYETDPSFKRQLEESIALIQPRLEAKRNEGFTPQNSARLNQMPTGNKDLIWASILRAATLRAPYEISARVEQLPAEVEWLENWHAVIDRKPTPHNLNDYQKVLKTLNQRRLELADLFFDDQLLYLYMHELVEFVDASPTSTQLNAEKFPNHRPPYTPDRPYVRIRVAKGKTLDLCRNYGGGSKIGGSFFFPCRSVYFKSSREAHDTGALPTVNTSELWTKVTFTEGEEFYLGAINPQYDPTGATIADFGHGGMGGEIQFWRDPIIETPQGPTAKPYFQMAQAGAVVPSIEDVQLQQMQILLRAAAQDYGEHSWAHALRLYEEVVEINRQWPSEQRTRDLQNAWAELRRFHHLKFITYLNTLLTQVHFPWADRAYFENKGLKMEIQFWDRDRMFNQMRSREWIESHDWSEKVRLEYERRIDTFFQNGVDPKPLLPAEWMPSHL